MSHGFLPYRCPWALPFLMTYSGSERRSIVYLTNFQLTAVSFCKKCPHVQQTMPMFQYDRHAVHCVLGSVSSNSHSLMLPTSWIIFFDSGLKGFNDWFCRRFFWRACRFGWFSIFWINSRTLVLCACFTIKCGSPEIRKSMFTSFSIVCSWLKLSWSTTGLSVLSRSVWSPTLNVSLSWTERVWELSGTFSVFASITSLLVLSCAFFNVGILTVSITGLTVPSRIGFRIGNF